MPVPTSEFRLDLSNEAKTIEKYFSERIECFDSANNDGPGAGQTVTEITVGYQYDQAGWVAMIFDTRDVPEFDGEWTCHLADSNVQQREAWLKAVVANIRGPIVVVDENGVERCFDCEDADLGLSIGDMLVSVVQRLLQTRKFESLPTRIGCRIYVMEIHHDFFWPQPSDKDAGNVVRPA